ncbi:MULTISPECIES: hypothetical protein [unclassified Pseudomonas]|uniref:hypothetical protein n=1 Tax=unclassified Pseudomonas TaxID=196821 RepID=UPI000A1DACCB|nr:MULTISPECIES: hypothetical protein [unclassified Pseudomonas]
MSNEFKREDRYFVIKRSDLDKLSPLDRDVVQSNLEHISAILFGWNIPERDCLVIESDWPEYDPAWQMIERRMAGQPASRPSIVTPGTEEFGHMSTIELRGYHKGWEAAMQRIADLYGAKPQNDAPKVKQ